MIIIPKLNMPKRCDECPCEYDGYCMALQPEHNMGTDLDGQRPMSKRAEFCPLIEKKPGIRILKEK